MNLFGNSTAAPSLTESIFGSSPSNTDNAPSNNDLFSKSIPQQQPPSESRKRPRIGEKITEKPSVEKATPETPRQTLQRRQTQSQHSILDQFTISAQDYQHSGGDDELYADVRSLMRHHGLVILRNVLSEQDVTTIATIADDTQRHICDALDAKKIPYNSSVANEETETFVYKELAVRCQGRMDVRYDYDDNVTTATTKQQEQLPSSLIELVDNLAASILHGAEQPSLVYSGWIFSHPGSANQPWHTDGSPLFGNGFNESLPSYAINVFVGLHDADELLVLGPTEFVVGSHQMDPEVVMDTMIDTAVPAVIGKGDVLLYDYRVCHRGTANLSSTLSVEPSSSLSASEVVDKEDDHDETSGEGVIRKVLYQMYARPWFKEHLNFGEKSLFEE